MLTPAQILIVEKTGMRIVGTVGDTMAKALIVEDSAEYREVLKATLYSRFPRLSIAEADNAEEALRIIGLFRPQVAFVDIHLPGKMNGLQLVERLRAADENMYIVMITSHDLPEYRTASAKMGANVFLSKSSATRHDILAAMSHIKVK